MEENEIFEEYLNNRLSAEAAAQLEQQLRQDGTMKERFDFYRTLHADMKDWSGFEPQRSRLRATLKNMGSEEETPVRRLWPLRKPIWTALSVAAGLALVFLLWKVMAPDSNAQPGTSDLYAQYTANEKLSVTRGAEADSLVALAASYAYDKNYEAAIAPLTKYAQLPGNALTEPALYLGFCYMQTGRYEAAAAIFKTFTGTQKPLSGKARWHQALLYLKTGQTDDCKKLLDVITASGDGYSNTARQLKAALP
jgi:tetratricopeptide (TPR) repeat protein